MLQTSQIENPRCSAMIDQMRLRRATVLPVESQNFSSSGCHSAIQVVFGVVVISSTPRWRSTQDATPTPRGVKGGGADAVVRGRMGPLAISHRRGGPPLGGLDRGVLVADQV